MTNNDIARWVTIREAAALLGKSERTIRRWVSSGRLGINRDVSPHRVDISGYAPAEPDKPDVDTLVAENERLKRRVKELEADKIFLQNALAMALANQQKLIEAPRKKFKWPWGGDS